MNGNPGDFPIQHTYTSDGVYWTELRRTPAAGSGGVQRVIIKVNPTLLTSNTTLSASSISGVAPLTVHFTVSGLELGSTYEFSFGDNTDWTKARGESYGCYVPTTSSCEATHTFSAAGTYDVSLTNIGVGLAAFMTITVTN